MAFDAMAAAFLVGTVAMATVMVWAWQNPEFRARQWRMRGMLGINALVGLMVPILAWDVHLAGVNMRGIDWIIALPFYALLGGTAGSLGIDYLENRKTRQSSRLVLSTS